MTQIALWKAARQSWPDIVTSWNMEGLRWRDWGWTEMVWMLHTRNMQRIAATQKTQMRKYLTYTRDFTALTTWDNSQMNDRFSDND